MQPPSVPLEWKCRRVFVRDAPIARKNSEETRRDEFFVRSNVSPETVWCIGGGEREGGGGTKGLSFFSDDRSEIESVHV